MDRGADDDVGQRHPLGGADDRGDEAHGITPCCDGNGKMRTEVIAMDASGRSHQIADRLPCASPAAAGVAVYKLIMHSPDGFG